MLPLSETVYLWRKNRGLTQHELAQKAGIPQPNLSDIERGIREATVSTVRLIAQVLDVTPGKLVDGVGPDQLFEGSLDRNAMEGIADAVAYGHPLSNPKENNIARALSIVMAPRIASAKGIKGRRGNLRAAVSAWIGLKNQLSREEINSLIERVDNRVWP